MKPGRSIESQWPEPARSEQSLPSPQHTLPGGLAFLLIFVLMAVGVVIASWFYYQNTKRHFRDEVARQLASIADLKVGDLVQWRQERKGDASIFFKNASFSRLVQGLLDRPGNPEAQEDIHAWLSRVCAEEHAYNEVRLLAVDGSLLQTSTANPLPVSSTIVKCIPEALRSGQITFVDFYRRASDRNVYLTVVVPIFDAKESRRPLGVVTMRIDPITFVYPFLQRWPTPSKTAETLLVRREGSEVVFLNELRFETNTALNLRVPLDRVAMPAVQAALGREGIMDGVDYRGVPVISAVRTIPDSPWALVARIDTTEAYAPLREQLWLLVLIVVMAILGAGVSMRLVWSRQLVRNYLAKAEAAEALRVEKMNLDAIIESLPVALFILDENTNIVRVNKEALALTGSHRSDDLLQHRPGNALGCVHSSKDPRGCGYSPDCLLCPVRNGIEKLIENGGEMHGVEVEMELMRNGAPRKLWVKIGSGFVQISGRRHLCVAMDDITARKQAEIEREKLIGELKTALAEVKTLSGLVPICSGCKNIRDDKDYWHSVESYVQLHSDATFTHGLCPNCMKKYGWIE